MKRFLCSLLIMCLLPVFALAVDHFNFSINAQVFGANDIYDAEAKKDGDNILYHQDGCSIFFLVENDKISGIKITGSGNSFLAYCYAAMMEIDNQTEHNVINGGFLLGYYLMLDESKPQWSGHTYSGSVFTIEKSGDEYSFSIVR